MNVGSCSRESGSTPARALQRMAKAKGRSSPPLVRLTLNTESATTTSKLASHRMERIHCDW